MTKPSLSLAIRFFSTLLLAGLGGAAVSASDKVEWRTNYDAARKEAQEKNLPLFLDFGTEDCFHCKRMHAGPFRDAAIVKMLNERFVPLKIDANREPKLAQALRIQMYPTCIMAQTDGKILTIIEGYMEANRLGEHMVRSLSAGAPDWMARDFQEATKALTAGDTAKAIAMLRNITEDGKDRPVQVKAREQLTDLDKDAGSRLTKAKNLQERGQMMEALDALAEVMRQYPGTPTSLEATKMVAKLSDKPDIRNRQRERQARDLLAQAKYDAKHGRFFAALEACDMLSVGYRDFTESKEAVTIADEIRTTPEKMALVAEGQAERLANTYLALGDAFQKNGKADQAAAYWDKAQKAAPNSTTAFQAQSRMTATTGRAGAPGVSTSRTP